VRFEGALILILRSFGLGWVSRLERNAEPFERMDRALDTDLTEFYLYKVLLLLFFWAEVGLDPPGWYILGRLLLN